MKGQISFDLALALIVALIFLQSLIGFSENFQTNQEKVNIRLQEKQIIEDIWQALMYAKILDSGDFNLTHRIPKIFVSKSPGPGISPAIDCDISVTSTDINITVTQTEYAPIGTSKLTETIQNTSGISFGNTACGTTIFINKENIP